MQTLADRIDKDGPLNELDAVGWAIRLAKAVEAIHARGEVHGAISPASVRSEGASRSAKAALLTAAKSPPNTAYHSPERASGGGPSRADDVWAIAATLHALLTGSPAFSAASDAETHRKIVSGALPPLAVFDVGDDDLQGILDSALAREAEHRAGGVAALREALEGWHPDAGARSLAALAGEEPLARSSRLSLDLEGLDAPLGPPPVLHGGDIDQEAATVMREVPEELRRLAAERLAGISSHPPAPPPPAELLAADPFRDQRLQGSAFHEEPTVERMSDAVLGLGQKIAAAEDLRESDDEDEKTLLRPSSAIGPRARAGAPPGRPPSPLASPVSNTFGRPAGAAAAPRPPRAGVAQRPFAPIMSPPRPLGSGAPAPPPREPPPHGMPFGDARAMSPLPPPIGAGQAPPAQPGSNPGFGNPGAFPSQPAPAAQPPSPFGAGPPLGDARSFGVPSSALGPTPFSSNPLASGPASAHRAPLASRLDFAAISGKMRGPGRIIAIAVSVVLLFAAAAVTFYLLSRQLGG